MHRLSTLRGVVCLMLALLVVPAMPSVSFAQQPTGGIEGKVVDPAGSVVAGATVTVSQEATGFERSVTTPGDGYFRFTQLAPGNYNVSVTATGFKKTVVDNVTVQVGSNFALDVDLTVGGVGETVEVQGGEAQIDRTDNTVDGVVNSVQIANLPLNGRNFLNLAALEPGAEAVDGGGFDPTKANYTGVSLGGQAGRSTQISIDGGSVVDNVVGTTVQNFSQEIISEFQIGIANQDVSSGASSSGVVNVITKSGSNAFHGNVYGYFRDDSYAAYPALNRLEDTDLSDTTVPFQTERIQFDRQQFGGTIGGPIYKDKSFFFFNTEYNNQDSVSVFNIPDGRIKGFNGIGPQPFNGLLITARVDWNVTDNHRMFVRYSHDDNDQIAPFAPGTGIAPRDSTSGIFSSNSQFNTNRADGFVVGLTSVFGSNWTNDVRYNYNNFKNDIQPDPLAAPGSPEIRVISPDQTWKSGTNYITPQVTIQIRNQIRDDVSWTTGDHNIRFGVNYERSAIRGQFAFAKPARIRLYGPGFGGPSSLETEEDFLNAPVRDFSMGIGNDILPFDNPTGSTINNRYQFFFNDSWKINSRFTLNYGVAYRYDSNLWNTTDPRPSIIAPVFGKGTAAPDNDTNNWGPRVGFAWDVAGDAKTVIRGGVGIYHDTSIDNLRLFEGADVSPPGSELFLVGTDIKSALLPGGDARFGATPTSSSGFLTLRQALALIAPLRADLESRTFASNAPTSIEAFQAISGPLFSTEFELPYSIQYSIGVQRELPWDLVLQADFNYRKQLHEVLTYDANFADAVDRDGNSLVIIPGTTFGRGAPQPIPYADSSGFSVYKAGLFRLNKRFTDRFQMTTSYTFSALDTFGGDGLGLGDLPTNTFDRRADFGPGGLDRRHRLVVSGLYDFPDYGGDSAFGKAALDGWQVSVISIAYSGLPYSVFLPDSVDLAGGGSFTSYLPGTGHGSIGRDIKTVEELNSIIQAYNGSIASYAARTDGGVPVDPYGTPLRAVALLPLDTPIGGDSVISQDIRVTKKFKFGENMHLDFIFEGFNIFNVANLVDVTDQSLVAQEDVEGFQNDPTNYGNLRFPFTTLKPTSRSTNAFGSAGPRAFQFAVKFSF